MVMNQLMSVILVLLHGSVGQINKKYVFKNSANGIIIYIQVPADFLRVSVAMCGVAAVGAGCVIALSLSLSL